MGTRCGAQAPRGTPTRAQPPLVALSSQLAMVDALETHLSADPGIRLVVLDSVAFHFRQEVQDPGTRARQLAQLAQTLLGLAARHDVAVSVWRRDESFLVHRPISMAGARAMHFGAGTVRILHVRARKKTLAAQRGRPQSAPPSAHSSQVVLTNHITTRLGQRGQPARLVPALGDSWAHAATSRLMLYWQDDSRRAFLYKSPSQPAAAAAFDITGEGVRGVRAARPSATKRAREEGR